MCLDVLSRHGDELLAGAIVTAEPGRLRIRPAEAKDGDSDSNDNEDAEEND